MVVLDDPDRIMVQIGPPAVLNVTSRADLIAVCERDWGPGELRATGHCEWEWVRKS